MTNKKSETPPAKNNELFSDSIPKLYNSYTVPIFLESYAEDIADRIISFSPKKILEIAAGTGVVTRLLSSKLRDDVEIIATDFNKDMITYASTIETKNSINWQIADAMDLPFEDETFDVLVCQFGVMFFPDKIKGFSEAYRVLKQGGIFIFNVWDKIEENEFTDIVNNSLEVVFPNDPPRFLPRTPFGYYDKEIIKSDLTRSGFKKTPEIETVAKRSIARSPMDVAISLCEGTPIRNEILARDGSKLTNSKESAAKAIEKHFGNNNVDGKMMAHVIIAKKT